MSKLCGSVNTWWSVHLVACLTLLRKVSWESPVFQPLSSTRLTKCSQQASRTRSTTFSRSFQRTCRCLFSATLPPDILELTKRFMRDPVRILVKKDELTLEGIQQFYVALDKEEWKLDILCDLYEVMTVTQSIIYCNTRRKADQVAKEMIK